VKKSIIGSSLVISLLYSASVPVANVYSSQGVVFPKGMLKMVIITDSLTKDKAYDGSYEVLYKK
jgi:hypothetical protein